MPKINQYTYNEPPIGQGGMGCVYRACNQCGDTVALKKLKAQYASMPTFRTFFESEARALSTMSHPDIVRIAGAPFADSSGNLYLPMEFVEGITLEKKVRQYGDAGVFMPEQEAIGYMVKILHAFSYIHSQGKVHRDIKPSNIMLRPDGSVCIIDFGIAKDMHLPTGMTIGMSVGTDGYMSPEQINGLNIDHRTDIYSLGCLLYFMLTGHHAISKKSNDFETRCAILQSDFPLPTQINSSVSPATEQAILRATDKNMLKRFTDASAFSRALTDGQNITSAPSGISSATTVNGTIVTVGRNPGNTVVMPSSYISGQHLDICIQPIAGEQSRLTITDHSTNGTAVDGRFLKHGSISLPYIGPSSAPEVLLSGRPECQLDWNQVLPHFGKLAYPPANPPRDTTGHNSMNNITPRPGTGSILMAGICVILALIIIILLVI